MPRSIAGRTVEELGGPDSVLTRQPRDHEQLDRLLTELDGVEQEHQEVNELVSALERDGRGDPRRPERLAPLAEVLRMDVRDEEDLLLPRLQEESGVEELRRLGRQWALVRRIAPTRPHPTVSRRPPGNAVSAPPLSLLGRTRDLLDTGARRAPDRLALLAGAAGGGLAKPAALVERTHPALLGDRPPTSR